MRERERGGRDWRREGGKMDELKSERKGGEETIE